MYCGVEWFVDNSRLALCRTVAGEREIGEYAEVDFEISMRDIPKLVIALEESGFIKPRLDERLRVEDLKITHRLLDIIEKK